MLTQEHLDKAAAFHGHICPGMLIGFKAVEGAIAQLGLSDESLPAVDEEIVAVFNTKGAESGLSPGSAPSSSSAISALPCSKR